MYLRTCDQHYISDFSPCRQSFGLLDVHPLLPPLQELKQKGKWKGKDDARARHRRAASSEERRGASLAISNAGGVMTTREKGRVVDAAADVAFGRGEIVQGDGGTEAVDVEERVRLEAAEDSAK